MRKLSQTEIIYTHSALEKYLDWSLNRFGADSEEYQERKELLEPLLKELLENEVTIGSPAAAMGAKGGSAKTEAQQAARRANGAKGGRPRKVKADDA
jgi:hypothetical protein